MTSDNLPVLYEPKFKAGDRVRHAKYGWETTIIEPDKWIADTDFPFASLVFAAKDRKGKFTVRAFGSPTEFELVAE